MSDVAPDRRVALAAVGLALLVAGVAAFPASGAGLTDAARALGAGPGAVSDGVLTWTGFAPLTSVWGTLSPMVAHVVALLLWLAVVGGVFALARRLGAGVGGAGIGAIIVAAHPLGAAVYGDVAAGGVLCAAVGVVWGIRAALDPAGRRGMAAVAVAAVAFGVLGNPFAALTPAAAALMAWTLQRPAWRAALIGQGVVALGLGLAVVLQSEPPVDLGSAIGPVGAAALVGRAVKLAVTGTPLTRKPWELDLAEADLADYHVFVGIIAIIGGLAVAWRLRRSGVAAGLSLALLWLVALGALAGRSPSLQPPALVAPVTIGLALALALALKRADLKWVAGAALACVIALLTVGRPVEWFANELSLQVHELAVLPDPAPLRLALAEQALVRGAPGHALRIAGDSDDQRLIPTRVFGRCWRRR